MQHRAHRLFYSWARFSEVRVSMQKNHAESYGLKSFWIFDATHWYNAFNIILGNLISIFEEESYIFF